MDYTVLCSTPLVPEHVTVDSPIAVIRNVDSRNSTPSLLELRSVAFAVVRPSIVLVMIVPGRLITENWIGLSSSTYPKLVHCWAAEPMILQVKTTPSPAQVRLQIREHWEWAM